MSPARNYRGTTTPPRWWEKTLSHPLELMYSLMGLALGVIILLGEIIRLYEPSRTLSGLPMWNGLMLGSLMLIGSAFIGVAVVAPMPDLEAEFLVEKVGLLLSALAWMQYSIAMALAGNNDAGIVLGLGMTGALVMRFLVTLILEGKAERLVKYLRRRWP